MDTDNNRNNEPCEKGNLDMDNTEPKYVVVAIRHFINGEHHWMAPEGDMPYGDSPSAFGARGINLFGKPLFATVKSAEDWAMSLRNGEWALAQHEDKRPTFVVVENDKFSEIMWKDAYPWPDDCEEWNDAQAADFERACDCDEFIRNRIWDSDADEEFCGYYIGKVNEIPGLSAWIDDGYVCVQKHDEHRQAVADAIEEMPGFPRALKFVRSDESSNLAWYDIEES